MRRYPLGALIACGGLAALGLAGPFEGPAAMAQTSQPRLVVFETFNNSG